MTVIHRPATGAALWPGPRPRRAKDNRLNLSSNELAHPQLAGILRELYADFDPAVLRAYPEQYSAAEHAAEAWGIQSPEHIVFGAGSDSLLRLIQLELRDEFEGRLILASPSYEAWTISEAMAGWRVTGVPEVPGDGLSDGQLTELVQVAPPSVIAVCWPGSPSGRISPLAELEQLSRPCAEHGHHLVIDACYAAFVEPSAPRQLLRLAEAHCLVVLSWSKMFGLAGGRLAMAAGSAARCRRLRLHRQEDHVNALMLHAVRGIDHYLNDYQRIWFDIAAERARVRQWLTEVHDLSVPESGGNFLHLPLPDPAAAQWLTSQLDRAGFRVRDMQRTPGLEHHVRFTIIERTLAAGFISVLDNLLSASEARW